MTSKSTSWKQHYSSLSVNEVGNKKMCDFTEALLATKSKKDRVSAIPEDNNSIILIANKKKAIEIIHSPFNFRGRRTRAKNKIACMTGLCPMVISVILNSKQAIAECKIFTPTVEQLKECMSPEMFKALY